MKCDVFGDESDIELTVKINEDQLRSYIKQIYSNFESFR